ncbi:MAG: phosphoserine phosphatase SerB [Candidatus Nanopelagicus sp.]|jgi:phosphoserine phosphatase
MPIENKAIFTGLILVSGEDRPGITENLMQVLSAFSVTILDIEQLIIRDRLLLTVLLSLDEAHAEAIVEDLNALQEQIGLDIAIDFTQQDSTTISGETLRVVIVGNAIKPSGLAAVASQIAKLGGNISAIKRTAVEPLISIELELSIPNNSLKEVQGALASVAIENKIDLAVEPGGLQRKSKRIVMLDMDSTLIEQEVINLLGKAAGQSNEIEAITDKAMAGDLDFKTALLKRVGLLKGLDQNILNKVRDEITLTKGAKKLVEVLQQQGHKVGVVSGGFIEVIEPILKSLNIEFYRANKLEINNGTLTGELDGPLIDSQAKRIALEEFANQERVSLEQTVAIGDGANDVEMIKAAGLGIAFNAKPKVAAAADTTISNRDLSTVLLLMGISI